VPLIRTPDRYRANADILEYGLWPHDRRKLIDDLWLLALAHLAELPAYEQRVNQKAGLTGRNLEPWRAILAVALWLEEKGVADLWQRMEDLSQSYQTERPDLEATDLTILVIRALCRIAVSAVSAVNKEGVIPSEFTKTAFVTQAVKEIAEETEADIDTERITARRIGRVIGKMRFEKDRTAKAKGWKISLSNLEKLCNSYGLLLPEELRINPQTPPFANGTNGIEGITAQADLLQGEL
jgi:hypothetical protein